MLRSAILARLPHLEHGFSGFEEGPPSGFVHLHQVHSNIVVDAGSRSSSELEATDADALVARRGFIAVRTADCIPVLIAAGEGDTYAAVHAGWRGLESGIIPASVRALGVAPAVLSAAIGPSIAACCYEVSREICDRFERAWGRLWRGAAPPWTIGPAARPPDARRSTATAREENIFIDLQRIARLQLADAGIAEARIEDLRACTYCGPPEYASYRRAVHEGTAKRYQWSWIGRAP